MSAFVAATFCSSLTHFWIMFPFNLPENSRKPLIFWCFQGVEKGCLGNEWVNLSWIQTFTKLWKNIPFADTHLHSICEVTCITKTYIATVSLYSRPHFRINSKQIHMLHFDIFLLTNALRLVLRKLFANYKIKKCLTKRITFLGMS